MVKLSSEQALGKVNEFLKEIEILLDKRYEEGYDFEEDLENKIKAVIKVSFEDWKEKISNYDRNVHSLVALIGYEPSEEEKQSEYISIVKIMKNQVMALKEELQLLSEIESSSLKLDKAEKEIEEARKEADRREAVTESKFYGAAIEIIDRLRDELRRRDDFSKDIIEIKKDIADIKEMVIRIVHTVG